MMKEAPKPAEEGEEWLTTYADAITLLMCFFVMLLSFSKIDIPTFEQVAAGIKKEIGHGELLTPMKLMQVDLQDVIYSMQADQAVNIGTDDRGVVMELASSAFYKPGSADIRDEASPVLEKIGQTLMAPRYQDFAVEVEGHTDDVPISTARYPSNWELSAGRATRVVRFLSEQGMDPTRLKAVGFAETRPKLPNRDAEGKPIPENQAANRRVVIRLVPTQGSAEGGRGKRSGGEPGPKLIEEYREGQTNERTFSSGSTEGRPAAPASEAPATPQAR